MRHFSAGEGLCPPRRSNIAHLILAVRLLVRDWLLSWDLQRGRREKETKRSAHGEDPGEQTDVEQGRAEIARAGAEDARYGFRPQPRASLVQIRPAPAGAHSASAGRRHGLRLRPSISGADHAGSGQQFCEIGTAAAGALRRTLGGHERFERAATIPTSVFVHGHESIVAWSTLPAESSTRTSVSLRVVIHEAVPARRGHGLRCGLFRRVSQPPVVVARFRREPDPCFTHSAARPIRP